MGGGKQRVTLNESQLRDIIMEAVGSILDEEFSANYIQKRIENRYKNMDKKAKRDPMYAQLVKGDYMATKDQVKRIENRYNELYCNPRYYNWDMKPDKDSDEFMVRFNGYGKDAYELNAPALRDHASAEGKRKLLNNPKFRAWAKRNGYKL